MTRCPAASLLFSFHEVKPGGSGLSCRRNVSSPPWVAIKTQSLFMSWVIGSHCSSQRQLTLVMLNQSLETEICICIFYHLNGVDSWNPYSWKTRAWLSSTVNAMAADVLVMQGARASAAMILLTQLSQWENTLLCNAFHHWLNPCPECSLYWYNSPAILQF